MTDTLTLRRPDDWHVHFRDGSMLGHVAHYTARQFARAVVMPNLVPPVTTVGAALSYRVRILEALAERGIRGFVPLMTCYLTDGAEPAEIARGYQEGVFAAAKLYPAHATTNSAHGVTDIEKVMPVLERMAAIGMPLLVHGEVTDPKVDIFDREAVFLEEVLEPLQKRLPELKVVLEHITTDTAVGYVEHARNTAATITAHHLVINRNAIFAGGIRPHLYCLPVAKRERHRQALRRAATSGNPKFFLGTDSAPHAQHLKESACGCAGVFTAATAIELYAHVFDEEGALERLEGFASIHGAQFYGLPLNAGTITLIRDQLHVRGSIGHGENIVVPFWAGETLGWRLAR
jgi:dihydroorotase